jgi:hypothetical protein
MVGSIKVCKKFYCTGPGTGNDSKNGDGENEKLGLYGRTFAAVIYSITKLECFSSLKIFPV